MAGAILCRPLSKSARSSGKTFFFTFLMFILHGARNVLRTSNMCSRNLLVTLSLSDRSRCGTVRFFCQIALAVAQCEFRVCSRNPFGTLGLSDHSLWRGVHFYNQGDLV